jgi:hypothetical protein
VVRGEFPDRQFDVDFWLEQGHEAIFDASWRSGSKTQSKLPGRENVTSVG